jgi:sulfate adenylyltransferase subunit 2
MIDDDRLALQPGEQRKEMVIRFRSLGCYPLSAAVVSEAANVADIVEELRSTRHSERAGRLIDADEISSMERKKREGYF